MTLIFMSTIPVQKYNASGIVDMKISVICEKYTDYDCKNYIQQK